MNIRLPHEKLIQVIRRSSLKAMEARQVSERLKRLFPLRIGEMVAHYATRGGKQAKALRHALVDQRYQVLVDEVVDLAAEGRQARIIYETHLMLMEARKSLRALRK